MKKILFITRPISPPWDEASKNFAYFLAKNAMGFEFNLLTPKKIEPLDKNIFQWPIYTSAHLDWVQRIRLLKLFEISKNFDILHFMLTPNALNSLAFKMLPKNPTAKTIQTVATLREDLFSDKKLKKIFFADCIVTYSDYAKTKLERLGFKNVKRIYPGLDLEKFSPAPKDSETLKKFGLREYDFVIMYPGEYVRLGATDYIIEALPEIFKKIPNTKFVFGCRVKNEADRLKKEEVMQTLLGKNLLDKVLFSDTFSDMPKLYNLSDVVVFPVLDMKGKFDVPLAVIEAFACEKPVVISDIPVLQEFTSEQNSVIIKAGDKNSLISSLEKLHKDEDLRKSLGKSAKDYAAMNFDIRNVAKQYENLYNKLLEK